ncbi:MAG: right-handed parallel beta-helix repeat-containing protein [Sphingobacteriales bacterium]|nr:MAG: right-handed parallel beta-helix repeat-containing protein [Sphingobacteriales bacterium]
MQRLLLVTALFLSVLSARATVYYVDGSKPDNTGNGRSWAAAKRDLQEAIYSATSNVDEVWVKAGTYLPTLDTNGGVPANSSECVFDISFRNIKLYGGFAGTETAASQRNPAANVTILSGDLDNSGTATPGDATTVLRTVGRLASCVIDGFTVTRGAGYYIGNSFYPGEGMYNRTSSPTINNCIFTANTNGPGMRNNGENPANTNNPNAPSNGGRITVTNCTISGNTNGTGIYSLNTGLAITNSTISGNTGTGGPVGGGGIYNDCRNTSGFIITVTNSTISGNTGNGGMYSTGSFFLTVTNSTISGNTSLTGGGMYNTRGEVRVTNSTISGNTSLTGGGMYNTGCLGAYLTNCIISGNSATLRGGGVCNDATQHTITQCAFTNNTCTDSTVGSNGGFNGSGGGLCNTFCSFSDINACVFSGNTCRDTSIYTGGGGIYTYANRYNLFARIIYCTFYGNTASTGGGIYIDNSNFSHNTISNCLLYNNRTYNPAANANKEELLVKANDPNGYPTVAVFNSIIRDYNSSNATNYYDTMAVTNNNGANPGLVDTATPAGPDGRWLTADDGLRISCSSVAKDAGPGPTGPEVLDAIGNPHQGTVDIGAYEAQGISTIAPTTLPSATTAVSGTPTANATTYYTDCGNTIAGLLASGAAPVSGSVIAKVNVLTAVPTTSNGQPYVQRTYDITPATNAATATATVTLYFTQAEFTAYNAVRGAYPSLPVDGSDAANNKANLRITQQHGTSATGVPGSYSGSAVLITPTSVTYNATAQRWEVAFPITGFSGFFAHTVQTPTTLPVVLTAFTARPDGSRNALSWRTTSTGSSVFTIERSTTGSGFTDIGIVKGDKNSDYSFTDEAPATSSYYRLRVTAENGEASYSPVALVRRGTTGGGTVTLAPQPASESLTVTNTDPSLNGGTATVLDIQGREVARFLLAPSVTLDLSGWVPGLYALRLPSGEVLRVVKQ